MRRTVALAKLGERLERDKQAERFEVIEQPVTPTEPIKPNRPLILAGGLGLAGGVALSIAFMLELLNRTVRSPTDVLNALEQAPLATIPSCSSSRFTNPCNWRKDRVARPGISSTLRNASPKLIRSRVAISATAASARSPMPRFGTFKILRTETSSLRLEMARR